MNAAGLSETALKALTPDGYKVEKTIALDVNKGGTGEFLVALSDVREDTIKGRPVMLLLVTAGSKVTTEDRVLPRDSTSSEFWKGPPNYLDGVTRESLGGDLILVRTVLSGGGSGSLHFFDFYKVEGNKLRLIRGFSHERTEWTYFAVYQNAIYDAEKVCTRGEKHGNAYIYTCYLQVTKYAFDGQAIRPIRIGAHERTARESFPGGQILVHFGPECSAEEGDLRGGAVVGKSSGWASLATHPRVFGIIPFGFPLGKVVRCRRIVA